MKRASFLIATVLVSLLVCLSVGAYSSSGTCGTDVKWTLYEGKLTISGKGDMLDWEDGKAPWHDGASTVNTLIIKKGITRIGNYAFQDCENIDKIEIGNGILSVGEYAFANCKAMTSIILPGSLETIEAHAFEGCTGFTEFNIPNSVTLIENYVFDDCTNLSKIVVEKTNKKYSTDDSGALYDKFKTTLLRYPIANTSIAYTVHNNVTKIEPGAFKDCTNLTSVVIPNTITKIDENVFNGCKKLANVIVPVGITSIENGAFYGCEKLGTITVSPDVVTIADNAFEGCTGLVIYSHKDTEAEKYAKSKGLSFTDVSTAIQVNAIILLDGRVVTVTGYNIGGNNFFKLRDVAAMLNGTPKSFSVGWDSEKHVISCQTGKEYTKVGGELAVNFNVQNKTAKMSNSKVLVDGKNVTMLAYNVDGNNYIKLRDLARVFDFSAVWNYNTKTNIVHTDKSYEAGK